MTGQEVVQHDADRQPPANRGVDLLRNASTSMSVWPLQWVSTCPGAKLRLLSTGIDVDESIEPGVGRWLAVRHQRRPPPLGWGLRCCGPYWDRTSGLLRVRHKYCA